MLYSTAESRIFSSNPRRMHSGKEDEEKEEQGLLWAVICPTPIHPPSPSPPAPRVCRTAAPAATLSGLAERRLLPLTVPPPFPWLNLCDFQRPRPKKRGWPLFRGSKVLQLNSDSLCDYVRIWTEVIGHLWAELGFWFFPEKRFSSFRGLLVSRR